MSGYDRSSDEGAADTIRARAVLLDNDGVLVDSTESIKRAFSRWSAAYGLDSERVYDELHGYRAIDIARRVLPSNLVEEGWKRLDQYEIEDADSVRALPGAAELVERLSGNWTVVSSGPRALVEARLAAAGLPRPAFVVGAEAVSEGKPSPECYKYAADVNGVPASECVAFEDSTSGMQAAWEAGCNTVRVGATSPNALRLATIRDLSYVKLLVRADWYELTLEPSND